MAYVVLAAVGIALGFYVERPSSIVAFVALLELPVLAGLVYGIHRWYLPAAALLFLHPIVSTLLLATNLPSPVSAYGQNGSLRVFILVVFLYAFADAVRAIYRFRKQIET